MKNKHTIYLKYYKNIISSSSLLAFLGFFLLLYYFYIRVVMERIPKNIPFLPTIYSFLFLFCIILIYIYTLFRMYYPKNPPPFILKLLPYIQKLYMPFYILNNVFRNNKHIKTILEKLYIFFGLFAYKYNLFDEHSLFKPLYITFVYIPRLILLLLLGIDIIFFSCIHYLYYFSILLFVPLIFQYFIYLMKTLSEEKIEYLNENFYIIITSQDKEDFSFYHHIEHEINYTGFATVKRFLQVQDLELSEGYKRLYEYQCVETYEARDSYAKKIGLDKLPWQSLDKPNKDEYSVEIAKEFNKWMPPTVLVTSFVSSCESIVSVYKIKEKYQRLIFLGYLFCWSYVFFVTFIGIDLLLEILCNIKPPNELFD